VTGIVIFCAVWAAIAVAELASFAIGFRRFLRGQPPKPQPELVLTERERLDPKVHFLFPEHAPCHDSPDSAEAQ
jgi:hypothetical protein